MNPQIKSVADIYAFNSTTLVPVISDLSEEDAGRQFRGGEGSSITFLVGHLLSSRIGLLKRFGETEENPYSDLFGGSASAQAASTYPSIRELASSWDEIAQRLETLLASLTDEQLTEPVEGYPVSDQTARGVLMFMAWHEAYHVGQIGMMRTEMGKSSFQARLYEARKKVG